MEAHLLVSAVTHRSLAEPRPGDGILSLLTFFCRSLALSATRIPLFPVSKKYGILFFCQGLGISIHVDDALG